MAYGQSKTAPILFAIHLNGLLAKENAKVEVFAVHPGGIKTGLSQFLEKEDLAMSIANRYRWKTIEQGAAGTVVAATSPALEGKGGAYIVDCNEAKPVAWASNIESADKLYVWTEKFIAKFF